ncbi:DJ-1 [Mycena rosella]|uniref:D-lactate dehydratase n=1 Tax=Mycena rosella TaxID=1033263 RepID=A0AAD7DD41_MYCRO|nr:DJ-1 [Mycena rosella]
MPSAVILLADGTEEMEFTITYDTLVRAGVTCCAAYVPDPEDAGAAQRTYVTGSRGMRIVYDAPLDAQNFSPTEYDALIVPGGAKGADTMSKNAGVQELVQKFLAEGKIVGMTCAGSLTALTAKIPRQPLTSHSSVKSHLDNEFEYSEDPIVVSKKLVARTAFPFALTLVRVPMVFPPHTPF